MITADILLILWTPVIVAMAIIQVRRNASFKHTFCILLLTFYFGYLIGVTIFPIPLQGALFMFKENGKSILENNFLPLKTINMVLASKRSFIIIRQLVGNFILLMPLIFLLPVLWERFRSLKNIFLTAFAFSLGIELVQLGASFIVGATYKIFDVDDIILNVSGGLVGYFVYAIILRITVSLSRRRSNGRRINNAQTIKL